MLKEFAGKPIRVLVVWEPVLPTDWGAPSTSSLKRIGDPRAIQYWDKGRLISHLLGEHDRGSIVWDQVAVFPAGTFWNEHPPQPLWEDGPVVRVTGPLHSAVARALGQLNSRGE